MSSIRRRVIVPHRSSTARRGPALSNKRSISRKKKPSTKTQEMYVYHEPHFSPNPLPLCETISITALHVIRIDMNLIGLPEGEKRFVMNLLRQREELQDIYFKRLQMVKQYLNEYNHCQKYREMLQQCAKQQFIEPRDTANPSANLRPLSEDSVDIFIGVLTRYSYYTVRLISLIYYLRKELDAPVGLPQLAPVQSVYQSDWYKYIRDNTLYAPGIVEKIFYLAKFCGSAGSVADGRRQIHNYITEHIREHSVKKNTKVGLYQDPFIDFYLRLLLNAPFSTLNEQQGYTSIATSSLSPPRADGTVELNTRPIPDLITRWNAYLWSHPSAYLPKERTNSLQFQPLTGSECLQFIANEEQTLSKYVYERRGDKAFVNKNMSLRTVIIPVDPVAEYREAYLVDTAAEV